MINIKQTAQAVYSTIDHWSSASLNRKVFNVTVTIAFVTIFSKAFILIKDLVAANLFGRSDAMDAFLIAFTLPNLIVSVVTTSLGAALIPAFIKAREQHGKQESDRLLGNVIFGNTLLLVLVAVLLAVCAPFYLPFFAANFSAEKLALTRQITYVLTLLIVFGGVSTLWKSALNAGERFVIPAASVAITPIVTIICLLLWLKGGIFALAVGFSLGALIEAALIAFFMRREQLPILPSWSGLTPESQVFITQYLFIMASAILNASIDLVDQYSAGRLPPGSVAALSYSTRIVIIPLNLAVNALGTAVLPYASKLVSTHDWHGLEKMFTKYLWLIFGVTVPVTIGIILLSTPITKIVFQRGAFTAEDTAVVSFAQMFYALQIPFYIANVLVARMIYAVQSNVTLMWATILILITKIILNTVLVQPLGVAGITLSTSAVYLVSFLFCLYWFKRSLDKKKRDAVNALEV
ncbi:MAG: lipid II flippase MurJ [Chloroflexota bacterium]